jgi:hypothetical protein
MFILSLSLLEYEASVYFGAHPLATGRHSGNARGGRIRALPQLRVITHGAIPPVRARRLTP